MSIKRSIQVIGVLAATLALGCGGWNQDPLDGKGDAIKKGSGKPGEEGGGKALPSDTLRVIGPDFINFAETNLQEFGLEARALVPGYTVTLEVENLADLPEAVYDSTERILRWSPPAGFVESRIEGDFSIDLYLDVRAIAVAEGKPTLSARKSIPMRVNRAFLAPEITRWDCSKDWLREGETAELNIYFRDADAKTTDNKTWGKVNFTPVAEMKSLIGLLKYKGTELTNSGEYLAKYRIDLTSAEVTAAVDTLSMTANVVSRYGATGAASLIARDVATDFAAPTTTWIEEITGTVGEPMTYRFLIMDPKQESNISVDSLGEVPDGATIDCTKTSLSTLNCMLTWTPSEADLGENVTLATIKSKNTDERDTMEWLRTLNLRTRVVLPEGQ